MRLSLKPSCQGSTSKEAVWAGTWMTGVENQPFRAIFDPREEQPLKYEQACVARSWDRVGEKGRSQVTRRHVVRDWRWMAGVQGAQAQGWSSPALQGRGDQPLVSLQFCGRCSSFFFLLLTSYRSASPIAHCVSQSRLYTWLLGDSCDSR